VERAESVWAIFREAAGKMSEERADCVEADICKSSELLEVFSGEVRSGI
jgi:hypothetical protein